ncbi:thioredoxin family protein, partial [Thermodesulfobacteriota bacterium]
SMGAGRRRAVEETGIEAEIVKKWTLSEEIREKYGLLLSPALVIEGVVVAQGKVYKPERIADILKG